MPKAFKVKSAVTVKSRTDELIKCESLLALSRAENARLRKALEGIVTAHSIGWNIALMELNGIFDKARNALKGD